ncbi:MAG TPA: PEP-CTERM sorting domain-containing protein [Chthoniobacterales bacterium]|jgi:hypothetical protein
MKKGFSPVSKFSAILLAIGVLTGTAQATITYTVHEQAGAVVFDYSGSIDLASATFSFGFSSGIVGEFIGSPGYVKSLTGNISVYTTNFTSASSLGPGFASGGAVSGSSLGLVDVSGVNTDQIYLPSGYVSGSNISGSLTFSGQSFSSLGLTPGSTTWTWSNGVGSDSATFNIVAVPEPSTTLLLGAAAAVAIIARRRKGLPPISP